MGKGKVNQYIKVYVGSEPYKLFLNDLRGIRKVITRKRPPTPSLYVPKQGRL